MCTILDDAKNLAQEYKTNPSQDVMDKIQIFLTKISYWLREPFIKEYADGGTSESRPIDEASLAKDLLQPLVS